MDGTSRFVEAVSFAREAEEFVFTDKFGKIVARVPLKEIGDIRRVKDDEGGPTPGIA